jgi:hypothetical protein
MTGDYREILARAIKKREGVMKCFCNCRLSPFSDARTRRYGLPHQEILARVVTQIPQIAAH